MADIQVGAVPRQRYRAVFLSPHLDDAVFSCGGLIDKLTAEGPVLVLNIFTQYLSDLKIHGAVLGVERYQEEADAARFLGLESRNLGELDAPFRRDNYRQLGNLFRPPCQQDLDWLPEFRQVLFGILAGLDYQQIYVPLGIGWHVDHVLTHMAFEPWARSDKLLYYEDAPYCCIPHATRYRLNDLARYPQPAGDTSLMPGNELRAWWQAAMAYADTALMKNLQPWVVRQGAVPAVSYYLWRLMSRHRQAAPAMPERTLQPVTIPIAEHFDRKVEAMALYRGQFGEFFSSRQDCVATLSSYARAMGSADSAVERYWRSAP
jgi:LmbE family N-acetylglucosaminyl deacetylase